MRVLHAIRSMEPEFGGPGFALTDLASSQARAGLGVAIACSGGTKGDELTPDSMVDVHSFRRAFPRRWARSPELGRWLAAHVSSFDIVHVHGIFTYPVVAACLAARQRGVPYVLRPAGNLDPWSLRQKAVRKQMYYRLVLQRLLVGASAVHVTSEAERLAVGQLGFADKARLIPHGVPMPTPGRGDLPPVPNAPRLLFLSRIHPKKALPVIFQSMAILKDAGVMAELEIAGGGEPEYLAELHAMIEGLGIRSLVRFLGPVVGKGKEAAFHRADLFILPSYQENFGIAAVEAMSHGLPVILSGEVAIADEVKASGAGAIVPVDDAPAIAKAVRALVSEPDYGRASVAARRLAEERFGQEVQRERLTALYRELLHLRR